MEGRIEPTISVCCLNCQALTPPCPTPVTAIERFKYFRAYTETFHLPGDLRNVLLGDLVFCHACLSWLEEWIRLSAELVRIEVALKKVSLALRSKLLDSMAVSRSEVKVQLGHSTSVGYHHIRSRAAADFLPVVLVPHVKTEPLSASIAVDEAAHDSFGIDFNYFTDSEALPTLPAFEHNIEDPSEEFHNFNEAPPSPVFSDVFGTDISADATEGRMRGIEMISLGSSRFRCGECSNVFGKKQSLLLHIRSAHSHENAFPKRRRMQDRILASDLCDQEHPEGLEVKKLGKSKGQAFNELIKCKGQEVNSSRPSKGQEVKIQEYKDEKVRGRKKKSREVKGQEVKRRGQKERKEWWIRRSEDGREWVGDIEVISDGANGWKCGKCGDESICYKTRQNVKLHINFMHCNRKKVFFGPPTLRQHLKQNRVKLSEKKTLLGGIELEKLENGSWICGACGETRPLKTSLFNHVRFTHLNLPHYHSKTFSCDICGKDFKAKSIMEEHRLSHSDVREFTCDECGTSYKMARCLTQHKRRVHEKVVRHACEFCGKGFYGSNELSDHVRVHHTDNLKPPPEPCACGKTFTLARGLSRHSKKCHVVMAQSASTSFPA